MRGESKSPRRLPPTRARANQLPRPILRGAPTRVYVATPVQLFGTERHRTALELVRNRFPDADLLDAAELFSDSSDWRRRWPMIVRTLDHLAFIADADGIIGAGVFQEILDASFVGLPVEYVAPASTFVPVADIRFRMLADGDPNRFAEVRISGRR